MVERISEEVILYRGGHCKKSVRNVRRILGLEGSPSVTSFPIEELSRLATIARENNSLSDEEVEKLGARVVKVDNSY